MCLGGVGLGLTPDHSDVAVRATLNDPSVEGSLSLRPDSQCPRLLAFERALVVG